MESQLSIRLNYARGKRGRRAKSFDAGNWRRFRNFDLSPHNKTCMGWIQSCYCILTKSISYSSVLQLRFTFQVIPYSRNLLVTVT